jgi:bifunctional DNA-binding transcriptional regulator/antitoxin component of YhaV-PrlF toxin-antitoxin module
MKTRTQAPTDTTREVKLSSNRQVGLPAEFARKLEVKPGGTLIATLVHVPGIGSAVLLMPRPESYAKALSALLAGDAPEGAEAYVRKLRREWRKRG